MATIYIAVTEKVGRVATFDPDAAKTYSRACKLNGVPCTLYRAEAKPTWRPAYLMNWVRKLNLSMLPTLEF